MRVHMRNRDHASSPAMQQPTRAAHGHDAAPGHVVVAYLASGDAGAPGTTLHRQALMRLLREAVVAAEGGRLTNQGRAWWVAR